jgi:hypothetical protein
MYILPYSPAQFQNKQLMGLVRHYKQKIQELQVGFTLPQ